VRDVAVGVVFDDGRVHATFAQTGTFSAVPLRDPRLPSITGKFTTWGYFNEKGTTVNGAFTFNLNCTGGVASMLSLHQSRALQRPPGPQRKRVLPLPLAAGSPRQEASRSCQSLIVIPVSGRVVPVGEGSARPAHHEPGAADGSCG
jgi:hypothetical protein